MGQRIKKLGGSVISLLDQIALRSFRQVLIHVCVAVGLAILFYFWVGGTITISGNNFVTIMSSIAAASGALLAVSLAFATFMSRFMTDSRERLIERLQRQQEKLALQMKKSAQSYPEISRRLTNLYLMAAFYIPGQPIDTNEVRKASKIFHDWANKQIQKSSKKIDFANPNQYDSFEKHLFNASLCSNEIGYTLTELGLAELSSRTLATHPPLITAWAMILIYALVFAIVGGTGFFIDNLNVSILIIPTYLALLAILALILDFKASIIHIRAREIGYEMAMSVFIGKSDSPKF